MVPRAKSIAGKARSYGDASAFRDFRQAWTIETYIVRSDGFLTCGIWRRSPILLMPATPHCDEVARNLRVTSIT
jgi:hypothetical protein